MIKQGTLKDPQYRPYTIQYQVRRVESAMIIRGEIVKRYIAPVITQYVDMETGEIIDASELRGNPNAWPEMRCSERLYQREYFLKSLREEVRQFAQFILKFRNLRRSFTPGIEKLIYWYALLKGKRACDVRRYLPVLKKTEFLIHDGLLNPLFQKAGKKAVAQDHSSEQFDAECTYLLMRIKHKNEEMQMKEAA